MRLIFNYIMRAKVAYSVVSRDRDKHDPMEVMFLQDPLYPGQSGGSPTQRGGRLAMANLSHANLS